MKWFSGSKKENLNCVHQDFKTKYEDFKKVDENDLTITYEASITNSQTAKKIYVKCLNTQSKDYKKNSNRNWAIVFNEIVRIHALSACPNIMKIIDCAISHENKQLCYVTPFCKPLSKLLEENKKHFDITKLLAHVANGLDYAYKHMKLSHLNLSQDTIYYSEEDDLYLIGDWLNANQSQADTLGVLFSSIGGFKADPENSTGAPFDLKTNFSSSNSFSSKALDFTVEKLGGDLNYLENDMRCLGLIADELMKSNQRNDPQLKSKNKENLVEIDYNKGQEVQAEEGLDGKLQEVISALISKESARKIYPQDILLEFGKGLPEIVGPMRARNLQFLHFPSASRASLLKSTTINEKINQITLKFKPFTFNDNEVSDSGSLIEFSAFKFFVDNSTYRGQWKHGKRHGCGEQYWEEGCYYVGYWKEDLPAGEARKIMKNGDLYQGRWKEIASDSVDGEEQLNKDSELYRIFYASKLDGYGEWLAVNGESYKGEWRNGVIHGKGERTWSTGAKYIGDFVEEMRSGYGEMFYENGDWYKGEWQFDLKHGIGEFIWAKELIKYVGKFVDDQRNGFGEMTYPNGECYKGDWKNNLKHGRGEYTWSYGAAKYVGTYCNDVREGHGEMLYENGDKYIGEWVGGEKHGKGSYYHLESKAQYIGGYVNDKKEGYGEIIYATGESYKGEWRKGFFDGRGELRSDGGHSIYVGDFVLGMKYGEGKMLYRNGDVYVGGWKADLFHGKGEYIWHGEQQRYKGGYSDGKKDGYGEMVYSNGDVYAGGWKDGLFHGHGEFLWADGTTRYSGNYVNGKKEGYGQMLFQNGSVYKGEWANGMFHGKGEYIPFDRAEIYIGFFAFGKKEGYGIMKYANGDQYEGEWKDDLYHGQGKYIWADGVTKYTGSLVLGKKEGVGKMVFADGSRYEGTWKGNTINGTGKYVWIEGIKEYTGDFVNSKHEGYGEMLYEDGGIYKGEWKNDKRHGRGRYISPQDDEIYGEWVEGNFVSPIESSAEKL